MTRLVLRRLAVILVLSLAMAATSVPAAAQGPPPPGSGSLELQAPRPAPPKPELRLEPTMPPEETSAREQEFYPNHLVRSRHEPAFVEPFVASAPVSKSSSARFGLSGWTAPAIPYDSREATGGVAFGLTILWGLPQPEEPAPTPPAVETR
jgi:hypothetical protein